MFHPTKRRIDIPKHDPRWNLERQQQSFDKITRTLGTEGLKVSKVPVVYCCGICQASFIS